MSAAPPDLTCAVIALVGGEAGLRCADALAEETGFAPAMIDRSAPGGATVPGRRRAALAQIGGGLVALVEDTTLVAPGWAAAVRAGLADPAVAAVWGPVRIAPGLAARYRALGRMEYGRFHGEAPLPQSPPGNCMAFRRAALDAALPPGSGFAEHQVAAALRQAGWSIAFAPGAASSYAVADHHGARLATRFGHGRLYAATSRPPGDIAGRIAGAVKALLVPLVLTARALGHARAAAPAQVWLAEAPHVALMALAWGAGEFTGHLFGKGDSERTWR